MNRLDDLRCFLLVLGYARSGRSILGNLLDAHANAIVCNNGRSVARVLEDGVQRGPLFKSLVLSALAQART